MEKYHVITFGCQMNIHDSEKIAGILEESGYEKGQMSDASLILINTCNVRPKAVQKAYSELGKVRELKKKNPGLIIGVCGCVPQTDKETVFRRESNVDLVFGTQNIESLPTLLDNVKKKKKRQIEIVAQRKNTASSNYKIIREDNVRAWVTIIEGCNNFCTYCVVPFTRGRENSRRPDEIFSEIQKLADEGYKEVVLLGQNVNSYGQKESFCELSELLCRINSINGLERIRFVTSHPKDFSLPLVLAMRDLDKVCGQIHLPVQSGSDRILSLMGRKYTRREYLDKIAILKENVRDVGITSDIIVGFPGETEEDFLDTLSLLEEVRYDGVFSFKYSDRPRTKAADMTNKINDDVVKERFQRLLDLQNRISAEKNREEVGRTLKVMVEGESKNNPQLLSGRTDKHKVVHFVGESLKKGDMVTLKITEGKGHCLMGELV